MERWTLLTLSGRHFSILEFTAMWSQMEYNVQNYVFLDENKNYYVFVSLKLTFLYLQTPSVLFRHVEPPCFNQEQANETTALVWAFWVSQPT